MSWAEAHPKWARMPFGPAGPFHAQSRACSEPVRAAMPRFSANLGHLYVEYPLIERIGAAARSGFKAIELQRPYELAPSAVKAEIAKHALTMLAINSPQGPAGEPGLAAVADR